MHDRHYDKFTGPFPEQNPEREGLGEAPPNIPLDTDVQATIQTDSVDGILNRSQESSAEIRLLRFAVRGSVIHLGFRIRMELNGLHVSEA